MKNLLNIFTFLILIFISCEKKISEAEFEKRVFEEVFINIVDSTYTDSRLYAEIQTIEQLKDQKYINEMIAIENDSLDLILAIESRFADIENIVSKKFIFKDINELPKNIELYDWNEKYKKFIGAMSFSKIIFNKLKDAGSIDVSYRCGGKCGQGYKVYLKKDNEKWKVVKTEQTWIS